LAKCQRRRHTTYTKITLQSPGKGTAKTSLHIRRTTGNADTSQNGKITRQLVLTAALEITDSDAADALSMRRRDASPDRLTRCF